MPALLPALTDRDKGFADIRQSPETGRKSTLARVFRPVLRLWFLSRPLSAYALGCFLKRYRALSDPDTLEFSPAPQVPIWVRAYLCPKARKHEGWILGGLPTAGFRFTRMPGWARKTKTVSFCGLCL